MFDLTIHVLFGAQSIQDIQVKQVVIFGMQFWKKVKCRFYEETKRVSVGEKHETLVEPSKHQNSTHVTRFEAALRMYK